MSNEELMRPRYKVIAGYPSNQNKVGDIITIQRSTRDQVELVCGWYDKFPHLFKKLEWWEEREIEEMPEYVKVVIDDKPGFVHKVEGWVGNNAYGVPMYGFKNRVGYVSPRSVTDLLPATAAEYEQYINQKEEQ